MKHIDEHIRSFVSNDRLRPKLCEAVNDNGNIIATDAHLLIVCPKEYTASKYELIPADWVDYKRVIPEHDKSKVILTISPASINDECNLLPYEDLYDECEMCEGDGHLYTADGNRRGCPDGCSDGQGDFVGNRIPSYSYGGLSKNESIWILKLCGAFFDPNLMQRIARVGIALDKPLEFVRIEPLSACLVYVGDILILIMPLRFDPLTDCVDGKETVIIDLQSIANE